MSSSYQQLQTAVLIISYKRLDTTKKVFAAIRKAKPKRLYISSNCGRDTGEIERVSLVRKYFNENIDWDCNVYKLYRTEHLSAKLSISGAIDWFFKNEGMGIILEDDCVPSPCFFDFCEKMLNKYHNDKRIFQISGSNLLSTFESPYDVIFSETGTIWGWATWADRWSEYDVDMKNFNILKSEKSFIEGLKNLPGWRFRWKAFEKTFQKKNDTWDFQWIWARFVNRGLIVIPKCNLVENIGEGVEATNTAGQVGYRVPVFDSVEFSKFPIHFHPNKSFERNIFRLKIVNALRKRLRLGLWVKK